MLSNLRSFLTLEPEDVEVNRARYAALSKQVPLMYSILGINLLGLSLTHFGSAPDMMTVYIPAVMLGFMALRALKYLRTRNTTLTDAQVFSSLRNTILLVVPVGAIFGVWGILFLPFGDTGQNAQAIFFNAVSVSACAFCLVHLRQAAILVLATVTPLTCILLFSQGSFAYTSVAFNLALVSVVLGHILINIERDFVQLVEQELEHGRQRNKLQALSEENHRLANTDSLTSLPNRRQFLFEIDELVEQCSGSDCTFVVALLDLDGFKAVNDVFGHPAGDAVLIETASRLTEAFADYDVTVARLAGDEFGLLIRSELSDEDVTKVARQACEMLRQPYDFDDGSANLSATIGLARFPHTADTRSHLFDRADYALYYAKHHNKSEPVFFSQEHERLVFENSAIEQGLRHADLEKEMSVEFQPVLDLNKGHTCGLEALARWYSPTLGNVRPDRFIQIAENSGIIGRLSETLFRKAVTEACHWPGELTLSFNLSAVSLNTPGAVSRLLSIARKARFPVSRLIFEITESAVLKDFESALDVLEEIKAAGARIAIDDFGTGFSSLAYVHRLPIDALKVDRSFVRDLTHNQKSANVLRSILDLCENMGLSCVVEGVETQEQFDLISDLGAGQIQGFYYSKPLSGGDTQMVLQIEFHDQLLSLAS
ncbi:EAL domain-containing protein [Thalassovita mediterranea]|nr:EAL domain-containing protein [Thalassovita mediterranea]